MDFASEILIEHSQHPRNKGKMAKPTCSAHDRNESCGDDISMALLVDQKGRIADIKFDGKGCLISQASASLLTESIKGKPLEALAHMPKESMLKVIGIPIGPMRLKCALLPLKVAKLAAYKKIGKDMSEEERQW